MNPAYRSITNPLKESELIINGDKKLYHINLGPDDIADNVIVVGDQGRVNEVSSHFNKIEHRSANREFHAVTGFYKDTRITVLSTGIGTDNIDIVINELDAAVNIDLNTRLPKENLKALNIIRLGTSGSLQEDIPVDSILISSFGLGLDGVLHYYDLDYSTIEKELEEKFIDYSKWNSALASPYFVQASQKLFDALKASNYQGITATANGFFGPQGRSLRLPLLSHNLNETLASFSYGEYRITNFEMETSALYGLSASLGHHAVTLCAIIANRFTQTYSKDYKKTVNQLIEQTLERLTSL